MLQWGFKKNCRSREEWTEVSIEGRPTVYPSLEENHSIVCGYDIGEGEKVILCHDVQEMQYFYDLYGEGKALVFKWYDVKHGGVIRVGGNMFENKTIGRKSG